MNYFPLPSWHMSKSWICLWFIKCGFKTVIVFMWAAAYCRCSGLHTQRWAPGCSSSAARRGWLVQDRLCAGTSPSSTLGVCDLSSLVLFCDLSSSFPGLGCVPCGIVFQIWHPEITFLTSAKPLCPSSLSSLSVTDTDSSAPVSSLHCTEFNCGLT